VIANAERFVTSESEQTSVRRLEAWVTEVVTTLRPVSIRESAYADGSQAAAQVTAALPALIHTTVRQREQTLYVWCEAQPCPDAAQITGAFSQAIYQDLPLPVTALPIARVVLYGRTWDANQATLPEPELGRSPEWTVRLEIQPHQVRPSIPLYPAPRSRQELLSRIETALGDIASNIKVSIRPLNEAQDPAWSLGYGGEADKRLWVLCEASYTPDPARLARPIATKLRELNLKGFQDAVLVGQVSGETLPEWVLRVDLTPPDYTIRQWAQWGDVAAIAHRLAQRLEPIGLQVSAMLRDATLHIVCSPHLGANSLASSPNASAREGVGNKLNSEGDRAGGSPALRRNPDRFPGRSEVIQQIEPVLADLSPRGIFGATVYGLNIPYEATFPTPQAPQWVTWLDLPAKQYSSLETSAFDLARVGNLDAITFLLDRILNPDLHEKLATGGIQVQLRQKDDLLYIMTEAPACPDQAVVCDVIQRRLQQLSIPTIGGIRVYGRRSGERQPRWKEAINFRDREPDTQPLEFDAIQPDSPPLTAPPEFGGIADVPGGSATTQTTTADLPAFAQPAPPLELDDILRGMRRWLRGGFCSTGLFVPRSLAPSLDPVHQSPSLKLGTALIWSVLGFMLTVQLDWVMSEWLDRQLMEQEVIAAAQEGAAQDAVKTNALATDSSNPNNNPANNSVNPASSAQPIAPNLRGVKLPSANPANSNQAFNQDFNNQDNNQDFNTEGFTRRSANNPASNPAITIPEDAVSLTRSRTITPADLEVTFPTLNSEQLDQQVALYANYVKTQGVPDILIVGSSRALRGIDPDVLTTALAQSGHSGLRAFNFGINGATAQVVELLLTEILTPDQLPRLILWADGARAFNSGREDLTYGGIVRSPGYEHLTEGFRPIETGTTGDTTTPDRSFFKSITQYYGELDDQLTELLAQHFATYSEREAFQTTLRDRMVSGLNGMRSANTAPDAIAAASQDLSQTAGAAVLHPNGFMAFPDRFNPTQYYEQYAKVTGRYDADYHNFQLRGVQSIAFTNVVDRLQANQITLVFINLPMTSEYLDPTRKAYERQFGQYMLQMSKSLGFSFRDFGQLWSEKGEYFSDPSHLNREGAAAVSERLAQSPMIPWETAQTPLKSTIQAPTTQAPTTQNTAAN